MNKFVKNSNHYCLRLAKQAQIEAENTEERELAVRIELEKQVEEQVGSHHAASSADIVEIIRGNRKSLEGSLDKRRLELAKARQENAQLKRQLHQQSCQLHQEQMRWQGKVQELRCQQLVRKGGDMSIVKYFRK